MEMTCTQATAKLCEFLDGILDDVEHALVQGHIASCENCAALLEEIKRGHQAFSEDLPALAASISPPPFLALKIKHKLTHSSGRWWQGPVRNRVWAAAACAVFLLAASVIFDSLQKDRNRPAGAPATAAGNSIDPNQRPIFYVIIPDDSGLMAAPVRQLPRRNQPEVTAAAHEDQEPQIQRRIPQIQSPVLVRPVGFKQDM